MDSIWDSMAATITASDTIYGACELLGMCNVCKGPTLHHNSSSSTTLTTMKKFFKRSTEERGRKKKEELSLQNEQDILHGRKALAGSTTRNTTNELSLLDPRGMMKRKNLSRSIIMDADVVRLIPLHVACVHHDSVKVVHFLIGLAATTLDAVDREGNSALHLACRVARHDIIALLLDKFDAVSVSKRNAHGKLPIDLLWESMLSLILIEKASISRRAYFVF
eukprot:scaffold10306_cov75-Skeletonema_marinoi.AAC.9